MQDFVLNEDEQKIFNQLVNPQLNRARQRRKEREQRQDEHSRRDEGDEGSNTRNRRSAGIKDAAFDDEDLKLALEFENACSPILRASARSIIQDTLE